MLYIQHQSPLTTFLVVQESFFKRDFLQRGHTNIFIVLMVAGTCFSTLQEKQLSPLSFKSNHRRVREIQSSMPLNSYGQQTQNVPYPYVQTEAQYNPYGQYDQQISNSYGQQTQNVPYPYVQTEAQYNPYGQQISNPFPSISNYPPLQYNQGYNLEMSSGYPTINPSSQSFFLSGLPNAGNLSPNVIYQMVGTNGVPIIYTPNLQKSGVINVKQGSDEYECSSGLIGGLICKAIKFKMHILDRLLYFVSKPANQSK